MADRPPEIERLIALRQSVTANAEVYLVCLDRDFNFLLGHDPCAHHAANPVTDSVKLR